LAALAPTTTTTMRTKDQSAAYRTCRRTCNPGNFHAFNDLQQVGAAQETVRSSLAFTLTIILAFAPGLRNLLEC